MSYRIPKIEGLDKCTKLEVSVSVAECVETGSAKEPDKEDRRAGRMQGVG